jgi:hypothetical protein
MHKGIGTLSPLANVADGRQLALLVRPLCAALKLIGALDPTARAERP